MERLDPMPIISSCDLPDLIKAAETLLQGNLVAFPTETVYGLGADATNSEAVAKIYKVKKGLHNTRSLFIFLQLPKLIFGRIKFLILHLNWLVLSGQVHLL